MREYSTDAEGGELVLLPSSRPPRSGRPGQDAAGGDRRNSQDPEAEYWNGVLCRLRADCLHFRNFDFRMNFTDLCVSSGTLKAVMERKYMAEDGRSTAIGDGSRLFSRLVQRAGGAACAGTRRGDVVFLSSGVLEAARELRHPARGGCKKLGLIFALHPLEPVRRAEAEDGVTGRLSTEEKALLAQTNFSEAFLASGTADPKKPAAAGAADPVGEIRPAASGEVGVSYPRAGEPELLLAEHVHVFRAPLTFGADGGAEAGRFLRPEEQTSLAAAVGLVPQRKPPLHDALVNLAPSAAGQVPYPSGYREHTDRLRARAQVEEALRACALLDCDGVLIGCAEGICGSELNKHPLGDVARNWAQALTGEQSGGGGWGMATHFKTVAFCVGGRESPLGKSNTLEALKRAFGAQGPAHPEAASQAR